MGQIQRVYCQFCMQSYIASKGERCDLCGKTGGLLEAPSIDLPTAPHDESWAPTAVPGAGISMSTGCLFIVLGCIVGVIIGNWLPLEGPGRVVVGGIVGTICGGLVATVVLVLMDRMQSSNRRR